MSKQRRRFVAKAEAGRGWRIWDNLPNKWWGERYQNCPDSLLAELNGGKRPEQLVELARGVLRRRL